jgi:hypothetical protein
MHNAHHYAVVIGINRYPALRDLTGPRADADDFYAWLVDEDGGRVPAANIQRVVADEEEERRFNSADDARPTSFDIERKLVQVHRTFKQAMDEDSSVWEQSRLYLYASGHGIVPSVGAGALLCASADPPGDFWDMIELSEIHAWYRAAGLFKEVVLLADCCRERRPLAPAWKPRFGQPEHYGSSQLLMAFATAYADLAFEQLDLARGYFTTALIDGLRGGAADPETGEIRADALSAYVIDAVQALTAGTPYEQEPDVQGDLGRPMVLRPADLGTLPRKRRTVTLRFPDGYTDEVQLHREGEPGERWNPAQGPWRLELDENLSYAVRPVNGGTRFKKGGAFQVIARDTDVALQTIAKDAHAVV